MVHLELEMQELFLLQHPVLEDTVICFSCDLTHLISCKGVAPFIGPTSYLCLAHRVSGTPSNARCLSAEVVSTNLDDFLFGGSTKCTVV